MSRVVPMLSQGLSHEISTYIYAIYAFYRYFYIKNNISWDDIAIKLKTKRNAIYFCKKMFFQIKFIETLCPTVLCPFELKLFYELLNKQGTEVV